MRLIINILNAVVSFFKNLIAAIIKVIKGTINNKRQPRPFSDREEYGKPKQFTVEKSKFSTCCQGPSEYRPAMQELPEGYGQDRIVLQIRDPRWLHCYWEVTNLTKDKLRESYPGQYSQAKWALRIYDVSNIIFNGFNAHHHFDISLNTLTNNWYINVSSGRSYCVDLGLKLRDGRFILVLRSNTVTTPLDQPSWIVDEEWMIPDEEFYRLYGFGPSATSPMGKRKRRGMFEHVSSSGFIAKPKK